MARRCQITGKGVMSGNHVSHANNKLRRRFLPNMQVTSFMSELLGEPVRLKVSTRGIRTIEHNGGIDGYLLKMPKTKLSSETLTVKKRIVKVLAAK